ncbi:SAM-dependent methyltransferase [Thermopolyspora sp. NPDC052614]|uniref:SAM-dependent methyltransferase n=1 Tax=Thermopolyspora sp. NPDC052614 TaxID=3155682 RepID=UPI003443D3EE
MSGSEAGGGPDRFLRDTAAEAAPAPDIDTSKPHPARIYDYWLGGKHNYAADREVAEQFIKVLPKTRFGTRVNRRFLIDSVRWLAEEAGIRQFIDIGSGLPTQQNVHEVAQEIAEDARVVYVDNDPLVLVHADALLTADDRTIVINADLREPQRILDDPAVRNLIDFSQPVALLMVAVLHFIDDDQLAYRCVKTLCDALPTGSYVVIAHGLAEEGRDDIDEAVRVYNRASSSVTPRTREQLVAFFDGLTPVGPGMVHIADWTIGDADFRRRERPDDVIVSINDRSALADIALMVGIARIDR